MPPKAAKATPEVVAPVKEAKHKVKAAAKSSAADKKAAKVTPKCKQSILFQSTRMVELLFPTTPINSWALSLCHFTDKQNFQSKGAQYSPYSLLKPKSVSPFRSGSNPSFLCVAKK